MAISSIGIASRNFSTIQSWADSLPVSLTEDETGECYNDSEFVGLSTISGFTLNGFVLKLTAAPGESFIDHVDKVTNALRYDLSKGVGLTNPTSYQSVISAGGVLTITRLQVYSPNRSGNNVAIYGGNIYNCLVEQADSTFAVRSNNIVNSLIIQRTNSSGVWGSTGSPQYRNITVVKTVAHTTGVGVYVQYSTTAVAKNCAVFGFGENNFSAGVFSSVNSSNNATDGSTAPGSNNQLSLIYADQFESITDGTHDFKAKYTGSLRNGIPDSTYTNSIDIIGNPRRSDITFIGAWETPAPITKKLIRAGQTISTLSRTGNVVSVTLTANYPNNNLKVGQSIVLSGNTPASFNFTGVIASVTNQSNFTINQSGIDETASIVGSAGGHYTNLTTWEAALSADLTLVDEQHTAECYDDWSSGLVENLAIDGIIVDAVRNIKITATQGNETNIDGTSGVLLLHNGVSWNSLITIKCDYTKIYGIRFFKNTSASGGMVVGNSTTNTSNSVVENCYFKGPTSTSYAVAAIYQSSGSETYPRYRNCVFTKFGSVARIEQGWRRINFENCTLVGNNKGIDTSVASAAVTVTNCLFKNTVNDIINSTSDYSQFIIGYTSSSDSSAEVAGGSGNRSNQTFDFVDAANGNFLLKHTDTGAKGFGTDLSTSFTTDIVGNNRQYSGKTDGWDIGAFRSIFEDVKTIRATGGDYADATTWEANAATLEGENGDLTKSNKIIVGEGYFDWPTGLNDLLSIGGITTDMHRYPVIRGAVGHRHTGKLNTGFQLTSASTYKTAVALGASTYARAEYVAAHMTSTVPSAQQYAFTVAQTTTAIGCFGVAIDTVFTVNGGTNLSDARAINCLALAKVTNSGIGFKTNDWYGAILYNNTAVKLSTGFTRAGVNGNNVMEASNNVAHLNVTDYQANFVAKVTPESTNNASEDLTAPGLLPLTGITSSDFVDATNNDYSLSATSQLKDAGATLTYAFDIIGTSRPQGAAWDIGAFEYISAGGTVTSDTNLKWNLLQLISSNSTLQWNLLNLIQNDSSLQWNILQAISQDSTLQWNLESALSQVFNDSSLKWNSIAQVFQDSTLSWSLLQVILQNSDVRWSILQAVNSSSDLRWSILQNIANNSSLQWSLLNQASNDSTLSWSLLSQINSNVDLLWNVQSSLTSVFNSVDLKWSLIQSIFSNLDARWDTLNAVLNDTSVLWDVANLVSSDIAAKWNLNELVGANLNINWDSLEVAGNTVTLTYNIDSEIAPPQITTITITMNGRTATMSMSSRTITIN